MMMIMTMSFFLFWVSSGTIASLAPADLKKLKAQQRKAAKKAEQEKQERLIQEQKERQMQSQPHQKRPHNQPQDKEPDAPPVDDLLPQKLARVEDPLEQAIKFLQPLQEWASDKIETHLLAFEVYARKCKPLLMLQSVKRALKVDASDPRLHSCLIRLHRFLTEAGLLGSSQSAETQSAVASVAQTETQSLFQDKSADQLNRHLLELQANSLPHLFQGAKMMCFLNGDQEEEAVSIITNLSDHLQGVKLQTCTDILEALKSGQFGEKGRSVVEAFQQTCRRYLPLASAFADSSSPSISSGQQPSSPSSAATANHNNHTDVSVDSLTNHVSELSTTDDPNAKH